MPGTQDLLVILAIAIVVFGAKRIPEIGKSIGEGIKDYRKGLSEPREIDVTPPRDKMGEEKGDRPSPSEKQK